MQSYDVWESRVELNQNRCCSWKLFPMGITEEDQPRSFEFWDGFEIPSPLHGWLKSISIFLKKSGPYEIPGYGLDLFFPDARGCLLCDYVESFTRSTSSCACPWRSCRVFLNWLFTTCVWFVAFILFIGFKSDGGGVWFYKPSASSDITAAGFSVFRKSILVWQGSFNYWTKLSHVMWFANEIGCHVHLG